MISVDITQPFGSRASDLGGGVTTRVEHREFLSSFNYNVLCSFRRCTISIQYKVNVYVYIKAIIYTREFVEGDM